MPPILYCSQLTAELPEHVEVFPHAHPGLTRVVLLLEGGRVEVQDHDGVRALAWLRLAPIDVELIDYLRARLLEVR